MSLMKTHIPPLLCLFSPLLSNQQHAEESIEEVLVSQGVVYNEAQLVGSLCHVLKVCTSTILILLLQAVAGVK